jgi:hypothetical protein
VINYYKICYKYDKTLGCHFFGLDVVRSFRSEPKRQFNNEEARALRTGDDSPSCYPQKTLVMYHPTH